MLWKVLHTHDCSWQRCLCDASNEEIDIIHILINEPESVHYLCGYEVSQIIKPENAKVEFLNTFFDV